MNVSLLISATRLSSINELADLERRDTHNDVLEDSLSIILSFTSPWELVSADLDPTTALRTYKGA